VSADALKILQQSSPVRYPGLRLRGYPDKLMEDRLPLAELTETVIAMVAAHARGSNAANRQFFLDAGITTR
jgi:hypothetical protein